LPNVQLQEFHQKNGHIVEFAGFNLPLWFKGIVAETKAVRNSVGIFDISHMGRAIIRGNDSLKLLEMITTNNVRSLNLGEGHYSLICNEQGGIKDDVLVFHLRDREYLIVYNASNRSKDFDWFLKNAEGLTVEIEDVSDQVAMFALQGPNSAKVLQRVSGEQIASIPRFGCKWNEVAGMKLLISRTGYTGEDGFEIFVWNSPVENPKDAQSVWEKILAAGGPEGIEPCGLGARDILRLEAGLCLYGTDIDEGTDPYQAKLGFVVKLEKDFIGRARLQEVKRQGPKKIRIGLVTVNRVIPRHGYEILRSMNKIGTVTSGSLSPTVEKGIAIGYVETKEVNDASSLSIRIRDRAEIATLVKPPFYDTSRFGYARHA
jgi:aminomethyltransferase